MPQVKRYVFIMPKGADGKMQHVRRTIFEAEKLKKICDNSVSMGLFKNPRITQRGTSEIIYNYA